MLRGHTHYRPAQAAPALARRPRSLASDISFALDGREGRPDIGAKRRIAPPPPRRSTARSVLEASAAAKSISPAEYRFLSSESGRRAGVVGFGDISNKQYARASFRDDARRSRTFDDDLRRRARSLCRLPPGASFSALPRQRRRG